MDDQPTRTPEEIAEAFCSPDEKVRNPATGDAWRLKQQGDPQVLHELGERCMALLSTGPIQGATFAAIALAYLPSAGAWDDTWTEPYLSWWTTERDVRGHDPELGWVHTVAHGADVVGELGLHTQVPVARLLEAVADRILSDAPGTWRDQEDDRLAVAVGQVMTRATSADAAAFFERLRDDLRPLKGVVPIPDAFVNATHTLSRLYVVADGPVPDAGDLALREEIKRGCRETLTMMEPWTGA